MWILKLKLEMFEDAIELAAEEVDFRHIPIVTVRGITQKERSSLIELPQDSVYSEFCKFKSIIVPYNCILYAGELKNSSDAKTLGFRVVRGQSGSHSDQVEEKEAAGTEEKESAAERRDRPIFPLVRAKTPRSEEDV